MIIPSAQSFGECSGLKLRKWVCKLFTTDSNSFTVHLFSSQYIYIYITCGLLPTCVTDCSCFLISDAFLVMTPCSHNPVINLGIKFPKKTKIHIFVCVVLICRMNLLVPRVCVHSPSHSQLQQQRVGVTPQRVWCFSLCCRA